ncbi:hypothetical protein DV096_09135 [Bradymonadaceae bacterium TMQ3]|nr:hypothetical protein DV096_09135 [Bradymonadaceae bacterium TMQ3]
MVFDKKENQHGVIQLIGKVFSSSEQTGKQPVVNDEIVFIGETRLDAKRAMLRYWARHQNDLGLSLDQFSAKCRLLADHRTIVYRASH